jgi:hypothetical protein
VIVKELDPLSAADPLAHAGHQAEAQLAHYLRRAFETDAQLFVYHGLRLEQGEDAAQIDHLILHPFGMILVESKSVTTRIKVNEHEEWMRAWSGTWRGMPSPIRQVQRQGEFLRAYLQAHREGLRNKYWFGRRQGGFRYMPLDRLVAISDEGIIDRPRRVPLPELCKADQVAERIRGLVAQYRKANHWANLNSNEGLYCFNEAELARVRAFLLAHHRPLRSPTLAPDAEPAAARSAAPASQPPKEPPALTAPACPQCQGRSLAIQYGRYGYYFQCLTCAATTGIQQPCPQCRRKARVRKQGNQFFAECTRCGTSRCFHTNPEPPRKEKPALTAR